jgi:hypothetical protein
VTDALEAIGVDDQNFPAPGRGIAAQPDAVKRYADHGMMDAMLSQDCGDVCVMVLHAECWYAMRMGQPQRQLRAEKVGMQVVGDCVNRPVVLCQQLLHRRL